jgi:hypothetical protein
MLDSETTQRDVGAARVSDIGAGASYQAARCGARQRLAVGASRCDGGPQCYAMSSGGPGFLYLQGFRVLGFGIERRSRSIAARKNVMFGVRPIDE